MSCSWSFQNLEKACRREQCTFDKNLPKSSSFCFSGVISSTESAMESLQHASHMSSAKSSSMLRRAAVGVPHNYLESTSNGAMCGPASCPAVTAEQLDCYFIREPKASALLKTSNASVEMRKEISNSIQQARPCMQA